MDGALVAPIQIFAGDQHGLNTLEHQPAKIMAMEGHYQSHPDGAPLILFGLPDRPREALDYAIEIPKLGSLILKHELDAPLAGLDTIPRENWPPVADRVLVVPRHGRPRLAMLGLGLLSLLAALARHARPIAAVAPLRGRDGAGRFRRGAGRLDHHRGRPPALYGLRPAADGGIRIRRSRRPPSPRR